jgi:hypothetical protein
MGEYPNTALLQRMRVVEACIALTIGIDIFRVVFDLSVAHHLGSHSSCYSCAILVLFYLLFS